MGLIIEIDNELLVIYLKKELRIVLLALNSTTNLQVVLMILSTIFTDNPNFFSNAKKSS